MEGSKEEISNTAKHILEHDGVRTLEFIAKHLEEFGTNPVAVKLIQEVIEAHYKELRDKENLDPKQTRIG